MAKQIFPPRKQRTREHVIAAQSVNHVERFIIDEGHTVQRFEHDYGYDLVVFTNDADGYAEEGSVYIQLKAARPSFLHHANSLPLLMDKFSLSMNRRK